MIGTRLNPQFKALGRFGVEATGHQAGAVVTDIGDQAADAAALRPEQPHRHLAVVVLVEKDEFDPGGVVLFLLLHGGLSQSVVPAHLPPGMLQAYEANWRVSGYPDGGVTMAGGWHCMESERVQTVLFDYGGVLAQEGFREGLRAIAEAHGYAPTAFFDSAREAIYQSGYVVGRGREEQFWTVLRQAWPLQESDAQLRAQILRRFCLRPTMLEAVRQLREAGRICAILSDQTDWLEQLDGRDHFYQYFDRVYNSYRLGMSKREPRIFDRVTAELGAAPAATLFIDDDAGHVARARERGLQALLFTDEAACLEQLARLTGVALNAYPDGGG